MRRADSAESLGAADLELFATAAYLVGNVRDTLDGLQRAHHAYAEDGETRRAARCLFWLGFILMSQGDIAPASGWFARASRLLEDEGETAEQGLLRLPRVFEAMALGDLERAVGTAHETAEIGGKCGDADVLSLGLHWQGRAMVKQGRLAEGMALLDESMTAVVSGEVAPYVAGSLYCSMIDVCREIVDIRRANEWTTALTVWCDDRPEVVTFSGQCLVHRAEIMQLKGQWQEAAHEAEQACELLARSAAQYASGAAWYRRGEICRARGLRARPMPPTARPVIGVRIHSPAWRCCDWPRARWRLHVRPSIGCSPRRPIGCPARRCCRPRWRSDSLPAMSRPPARRLTS